MTTTQIDQKSTVIELGTAISPETEGRARRAIATVMERRPDARVHVRIINDHDAAHGHPVVARALVDGQRAARVVSATPDEAVDELARRLEEWLGK
jgi:hypothetical protein